MPTVYSGVSQGSQLPVSLPYLTCSPSAGSQLEGAGVGLAGWEPGLAAAWAREPFRHHTGLSPSQIFSVTDPYEFVASPNEAQGITEQPAFL